MANQYAEWKSVGQAELAKQKKMQKEIDQLNRKLDRAREELDQTYKRLVNSRNKYTGMQEELDRVKKELGSTQIQLDQRPTLSTSHEQEKVLDTQRLKLLDELRAVNKENAILKKQLAGGSVASVTADPVASYKPRGIGPKNQLTGTDLTAYALWKWVVNDKLRVDAVIYPKERDWISYAFHQLAQPIFQQLDAWINANADDLSMEDFYKQIEHSMGINMLVKRAEDELHVVTIKPTGGTVDDYYQRIFKLWEQARTTEWERVRKFEIT